MSPYLPQLSGTAVISLLAHIGFVQVSQKGSHVKLKHPDGHVVIVPVHKDLAPGTLRSIIRQAGLTVEGFRKLVDQ